MATDRASRETTAPIHLRRPRISHVRGPGAAFPAARAGRFRWGPGSLPRALSIMRRPLRSVIRMVRAFLPLVDFKRRWRSAVGTSSTERYTRSEPPAEINTDEVWNRPAAAGFRSPQPGQRGADSLNSRPQLAQAVMPLPAERAACEPGRLRCRGARALPG